MTDQSQGPPSRPSKRPRPSRHHVRHVALRTLSKSWDDSIFSESAQAAFWCCLSLPPLLLGMLGSLAYVAPLFGPDTLPVIESQLISTAGRFFSPNVVSEIIEPTVRDIVRGARGEVVSIGFVIITVLLIVGSLNLSDIVRAQDTAAGVFGWYWLPLFPMFVIFFISALAETNRPPFDLPEAESELVAGYMVEYSSTPYLLFMLGEYVAIMSMCALGTILFLGGWLSPIPFAPFTWVPGVIWFTLKASFLFFLIAMVKAMVPRYRYDQIMRLGWKVFLPISLVAVVVVAAVLLTLPSWKGRDQPDFLPWPPLADTGRTSGPSTKETVR